MKRIQSIFTTFVCLFIFTVFGIILYQYIILENDYFTSSNNKNIEELTKNGNVLKTKNVVKGKYKNKIRPLSKKNVNKKAKRKFGKRYVEKDILLKYKNLKDIVFIEKLAYLLNDVFGIFVLMGDQRGIDFLEYVKEKTKEPLKVKVTFDGEPMEGIRVQFECEEGGFRPTKKLSPVTNENVLKKENDTGFIEAVLF